MSASQKNKTASSNNPISSSPIDIGALENQLADLSLRLKISEKMTQLADMEKAMLAENFWDDAEKASFTNQKVSLLQKKIKSFRYLKNLLEDLKVALEIDDQSEIQNTYQLLLNKLEEQKLEQFLGGRYDSMGAILSIQAGAGGLDASDWAAMLISMYQAYSKKKGWQAEIISLNSGEEGGLRNGSLRITGDDFVYGMLKEEFGVHRLIRISPFNSGKTRETSFALVEVLPDGLDTEIELNIKDEDLRFDYFMSSGSGGQSVNTTYSAVRVVHIPTGISVSCQNERSQQQNKNVALRILKGRLAAIEIQKQKQNLQELKGEFNKIEWGSQIRSYTLHPYKLIKDHRSNFENTEVDQILENGQLDDIIWSVKLADQNQV